MLVIPENLPEEEDINSELLDDNVFEDNDRLLDLDDDDDFELIEDAIDPIEELEYQDLEFTVFCYNRKYDDYVETDVMANWTYPHEWNMDDLKEFVKLRYPEGLKLGDINPFDNDGFYEFLLDKYEEYARDDASERYDGPVNDEPDWDW